jgi:hypothetical protein
MKTNEHVTQVRTINNAKLALWFILLTGGLFLIACNQEEKVTKSENFEGAYTLVTVNGNQVPTSVSHEGANLQVRSGSFTIKADGTCATKTTFIPPNGTEATREVSATYTKNGSKLTMQWKGAGITTGTIDGNTFTMDNEGMVFVYKK